MKNTSKDNILVEHVASACAGRLSYKHTLKGHVNRLGYSDEESLVLLEKHWLVVSTIFLFSPLLGEMIQFDYCAIFQMG